MAANRTRPALPWRPPTDRQHRSQTVWTLVLILLGILGLLPGIAGLQLNFAPLWSRAAILLGIWQIALAGWVITIPDWIALRVAMWSYAVLSMFYCGLCTILLTTPAGGSLPLDLAEIRPRALIWCGGMLFFCTLTTYAVGLAANRWKSQVRRQVDAEQATTARY